MAYIHVFFRVVTCLDLGHALGYSYTFKAFFFVFRKIRMSE